MKLVNWQQSLEIGVAKPQTRQVRWKNVLPLLWLTALFLVLLVLVFVQFRSDILCRQ